MPARINRREFVRTGAVAAGLGTLPAQATAAAPAIVQSGSKPVVIASANGHRYTNGGDETCVVRAFRLMTEGTDVL